MSSITGLISAGGGGGGSDSHIITDPKKLVRSSGARFSVKDTGTSRIQATSSSFFSSLKFSGSISG